MLEEYYGAVGDGSSDRDWLITDIKIPRAPKGTNSFVLNGATQYNQVEAAPYSCTVHGAMGSYTDLTGYKFSLEERKAIWEEAVRRGADPKVGWYVKDAVELVKEWVNDHCDVKVDYYRTEVGSSDFFAVMRLGYSPVVAYKGSQLFSLDKADGILDDTVFSTPLYGHCLRVAYSIGDEWDLMIDNYPYKNLNIYRVPTGNWKELKDNSVFFPSAYIYIPKTS